MDTIVTLVGFSPAALLALAVWLVLTGRIVPRAVHEDVRRDRDLYREAYEMERQARLAADGQAQELLEHARTTTAVIASLPKGLKGSTSDAGPSLPGPSGVDEV